MIYFVYYQFKSSRAWTVNQTRFTFIRKLHKSTSSPILHTHTLLSFIANYPLANDINGQVEYICCQLLTERCISPIESRHGTNFQRFVKSATKPKLDSSPDAVRINFFLPFVFNYFTVMWDLCNNPELINYLANNSWGEWKAKQSSTKHATARRLKPLVWFVTRR